jgi:hypothetical protein
MDELLLVLNTLLQAAGVLLLLDRSSAPSWEDQ